MTAAPTPSSTWARRLPAITWAAVGATGWVAVAAADSGVRWPTVTVLVVAWALVLVAALVPSTASLTVVRWTGAVPFAVAMVLLLAAESRAAVAALVAAALVHPLVVARAEVGQAYVQTSAYGDETRFPLRLPAAFTLPLAAVWLAWTALITWAMVALDDHWWLGLLLLAVATAGGALLLQRVHRLSMRWLVVVPAGVVVHDPVVLGETLMVQRGNVERIALALDGTEAADLSGPATGHAVEVALRAMVTVLLPVTAEHPHGRAMHVQSFLVTPSRPGAALSALADQRLPVG